MCNDAARDAFRGPEIKFLFPDLLNDPQGGLQKHGACCARGLLRTGYRGKERKKAFGG